MMLRISKILLSLSLVFLGNELKAEESPEYIKYVDEIVTQFAAEMRKKHSLHCSGSGGSMPNDVQEIDVLFSSNKELTVDEVRKIEVDAVQDLLHRINHHEKIRPFLREYPFKNDRVGISVSFTTIKGFPIGNVDHVYVCRNRIFYSGRESRYFNPTAGVFNDILKYNDGKFMNDFFDILDESFEDAVKLAEAKDPFVKLFNEIVESHVSDMKQKFNLKYLGSSKSCENRLQVTFLSHQMITKEEARNLELKAIQNLIDKINHFKKANQVLVEFPNTADRIDLKIVFQTKDGKRPVDGSINCVKTMNGKILYFSEKMERVEKKDTVASGEVITRINEAVRTKNEETYEEAVQKLQ